MNNNQHKIEIVHYPILSQFNDILHFTSTRKGGVSDGNYTSLNLGRSSGDEEKNIQANFVRFCTKIGISKNQLHLPYQTHGDSILKIDDEFLTLNAENQSKLLTGIDAVITNIPNQCIAVTTADCVPILIFDPVKRTVAAIHAGWRGTCARIALKAIQAMSENYHSKPKDLMAVIGASISPEAYEVGDELVEIFRKENFNTETIFFRNGAKYHLDLWAANKMILAEAGVPESNIEVSGYCTYSQQDKFFSARCLGIKSGRMINGIMLKN